MTNMNRRLSSATGTAAGGSADVSLGGSRVSLRSASTARTAGTLVVLAVLLYMLPSTDGFLSVTNARAVLASIAITGLFAVGQTVVMIGGSMFSLSLAESAAVSAVAFTWGMKQGLVSGIVVAIVTCMLLNGIQGAVVGWLHANPVIVTIAAGSLMIGLTTWITGGHTQFPPAGETAYAKLAHSYLGIPAAVYVLVVVAVLVEFTLRRTRFGLQLFMVGDNHRAARAAALPTGGIIMGSFLFAGLCAGIAAPLLVAANQQASLSLSGHYTYQSIAAALVGGNLVAGGSGSAVRAIAGAAVIAAISDLVLLRGYSSGVQMLVTGALVLAAIVVSQTSSRTRSRA